MKSVTLTWYEAAMASEIGRLRQLASLKAGRQDQHGFTGKGWSEHIEGACGECAVAKVLGIYWNGSIDVFKDDDLPGLQVRTRRLHKWDLLVRPEESDSAIWVHVTGQCPDFRIHGWLHGFEAKQSHWLHSHGGRPPAYFAPSSALHSINELPKLDL